MSRSAEVSLLFAGEERTFRLRIGRLRALQEKCDAGPLELASRMSLGTWRVDDVRETLLQGLIGGGMDQGKAAKLLMTHVDEEPLGQFVPIAQAVLMAAVVGADDEPGKPKGEAGENPTSPEASSALPGSTEQARRSGGRRVRSTTSPSGS